MIKKILSLTTIILGVVTFALFLLKTFNVFDFSSLDEDVPTIEPVPDDPGNDDNPTDNPTSDIKIKLDYENITF